MRNSNAYTEMISSDQNLALLTVANSAKENPLWVDYSEYCNYPEQGISD
jgi:hypothetical protein